MADELPKLEEILGYNSAVNTDSESITRRFYIRHTDPTAAKAYFENYASSLAAPLGLVLNDLPLSSEQFRRLSNRRTGSRRARRRRLKSLQTMRLSSFRPRT